MICRRCLHRASATALSLRPTSSAPLTSTPSRISSRVIAADANPSIAAARRPFSVTLRTRSSEPAPEPPSEGPEGTPAATAGSALKEPLSSCVEGTILNGLNYHKNRTDPVALADEMYPAWLWKCLEREKKEDADDADDAAAEFSKSKKLRRLAAKRARLREARIIAEGNLEALLPKVPLQHQTINLPGSPDGTPEDSVAAAVAREDLRKAMSKERRSKIKEDNYLKSM